MSDSCYKTNLIIHCKVGQSNNRSFYSFFVADYKNNRIKNLNHLAEEEEVKVFEEVG